ncbi:DDB1- and CUL4-associated factor 8 [Trachymyrmex cornetzi]|uniref:DDB1-and CUL4-associated factor 8 n=1 Tax=Trachymyrmex cornetzi TaxID=471704 RepID=A0A151J1R5_9HYME|nr:DDB1- and CUL4-associated factor 8 [Trachymyrmex cornetzi]
MMRTKDKDKAIPPCLKVKQPTPDWFRIVSEVINRQIGNRSLFQRRFYGSLLAVERLEFMHTLEHPVNSSPSSFIYNFLTSDVRRLKLSQGSLRVMTLTTFVKVKIIRGERLLNYICALNFNQKGNLLVSTSHDIVSIWDWAIRKKRYCFEGSRTYMIYGKWHAIWLPLDVENFIVTTDVSGTICLFDLEHNASKILIDYDGGKTVAVPETPYVVFSAGHSSRILSIDIRQSTPNELLVVREDQNRVRLTSIHCNPSNSNEFCVSGYSSYVRVYDRRSVSKPLYQLWSNKYNMVR